MSPPKKTMRRLILSLAAVALASAAAAPPADAKGRGGRPKKAYDLQFEDINPRSETHGERLSLSDLFADRGVVLQFTASWCKYCREEMPDLQAYYGEGETPMVFVAADEGPMAVNILTIAERAELTAPLLFIPEDKVEKVNRHYTHEILPATYFIDALGRIRGSHEGAISVDRLRAEVKALLHSGVPAPPAKAPQGE